MTNSLQARPLYRIYNYDIDYDKDDVDYKNYDIVQLGPRLKQSLSLKVWTKDEH